MKHSLSQPIVRETQIRRLRRKYGLTHRQADLLAAWHFGEVQI